jgi:epoxyqueuosine reductase
LIEIAEGLLNDPSPLVRAMAVWALKRLAPETVDTLPQRARETDEAVLMEWASAP